MLREARVPTIAVNNAYLVAPWSDILYFADHHWWEWHHESQEYKSFQGQKCTVFGFGMMVAEPEVHMLRNVGQRKLSDVPNAICTGHNSGYQALNIAYLAAAARILLLGFDMRFTDGRSHWHAGHPHKTPETNYTAVYAPFFVTTVPQLIARGVDVVNCSPVSTLSCFRKESLESILSHP